MTKRLVLFDLDGTILRGRSSGTAFAFLLLMSHQIGVRQWFETIRFLMRWFPRYGLEVFVKDKAYLVTLPVEKVQKDAAQFVRDRLLSQIKPYLVERVDQHLAAGDVVVLLTGTHHFIAKPIAEYLKIPFVEAAEYLVENDQYTIAPPLQHPFKLEKLKIAERLSDQFAISLGDTVAYGNSYNDRFLLDAVGEAIVVSPDRRLRKLAQQRGWEIL